MKLIWNCDKTVGVPIDNISKFQIIGRSTSDGTGEEYIVLAYYTICVGESMHIFTADTQQRCIDYLESI